MFTKKKLKNPTKNAIEYRQAELASYIKDIRTSNMTTIRELSEIIGVSTKTIWRLENGRSVKIETLLKILEVFDCYISIQEKQEEEPFDMGYEF